MTTEDYAGEGFLPNSERFRNRVRGTWLQPNSPASSLCNEVSMVIKTLHVLSKS